MKEETEIHTLDYTDLQLLDTLQRDASMSNQALAERLGLSPPTCLRRVRRLQSQGLLEQTVALVDPEKLAEFVGHGLQALIEVTLERQDSKTLDEFERIAVAEPCVQQCWRVSPGPDFILVIYAKDMPSYLHLSQKLFAQHQQVRNVKAFFATKRAKFGTHIPLLGESSPQK